MRKANWKKIALAALLAALLLGMTGCFVKPDPVEDSATGPLEVLPFATNTPTPTPPIDQGGQQQGGVDGMGGAPTPIVVTVAPTAPIAVITPSPTAYPAWTYSPVITAKPTDDGTLRSGSSGDAVKKLQQRLKDLGYYSGSVDGDFGAGTESAVRDFQKQHGLTADGIAGSRTLSSLHSSSAKAKVRATATVTKAAYATSRPTPQSYTPSTPGKYKTLQNGSSRAEVKPLQRRLKELGYYSGTISGHYDDATEAAVTAFQKRNGEWVDGVAGEDTQERLFSKDALPAAAITDTSLTASNTYRTLKNGMSGDDVLRVQTRLKELYYYNGATNGVFETVTELAIKVFQQRNGLTADGVAGSGTLTKMFSATAVSAPTAQPTATAYQAVATLQTGSAGEEVYKLQERLFDLGYYAGKIDGIYNDTVASAVRSFQIASKLTADGKAGASTQRALYAETAIKAANADNTMATLREGDRGDRVSALQNLLSTYGYYLQPINGVYDANTMSAVQQFQAMNNLTADGVAGPATNQLLYNGTPVHAPVASAQQSVTNFGTLKQGMTGPDVMVMQEYLRDYGYYAGVTDGNFNTFTQSALQAFQERNGLTADGVAGQQTLAVLYGGNAVAAEGATAALAETGARNVIMVDENQPTEPRTSMKEKDEGQDVFDLQTRLRELGFYASEPDGQYGAGTTTAVRAFQGKNGLTVDGKAGPATLTAMYAADVVSATGVSEDDIVRADNSVRELEEQRLSGAIQASLSGGGVAASYNSSVYYAGGSNGALYVSSGGSERKLYDGAASFIHATGKGVTFVSSGMIMRVPASGGTAQTLVKAGGIKKLALWGETMYYLEGSTLVRSNNDTEAKALAENVNDFVLDVFQNTAYIASDSGVKSVLLTTGEERLIVSTSAEQVQLCDSVLFFRSGGNIYRMQDGVSVLLIRAEASWMGIYRDMIYYIAGDRLYRCETDGQNSQIFYDGQTADVSFVAGKVYITKNAGGPVVEIVPVL